MNYSPQRNVHPNVGLVTKEEFDSQRGEVEEGGKEGEEGGKEGEEVDGEMVFPLDLQEGGTAGKPPESQEAIKQVVPPAKAEMKRRSYGR